MADLFISYSRKEAELVERLTAALKREGCEVWLDQGAIRPAEPFMKAILAGIEAAQAFVFVISSHSLASTVCEQELEHACKRGKRLIPILASDPESSQIPAALSPLHWISFRTDAEFDASVRSLLSAWETDLAWVDQHTWLLARAVEWEKKPQDKSLLLGGNALREAEKIVAESAGKGPQLVALQLSYVQASREQTTRTERARLAAMISVLVVALALTWWAVWQQRLAQRAEGNAKGEAAQALAERGRQLLLDGYPTRAAAYLSEAYRLDPRDLLARSLLPRVVDSVERLQLTLRGTVGPLQAAWFSPDGEHVVTAGKTGVQIWDATSGASLSTTLCPKPLSRAAFSPDGERVVLAC
ncbi:MAG TPA: TIR domain-containing protein, partial [Polyangiaceae bacterium]